MRLPSIKAVDRLLWNDVTRNYTSPTETSVDVRLCVERNGSWCVRYGDVSCDTHHSPYCGASTVSRGDSKTVRRAVAKDLLSQVRDQIAEET